ncbi:hypothetical protein CCACVL1_24412 [Corchorus capsularis]|uniref:Uncharacterized protein n=1 Tax=Corchorus capsularis TaxID=210143 RepID=A0A1R3GPZ0_COCAP|nr:hypothetical protein CCACVL1_24412 [Corchorus capsularis]
MGGSESCNPIPRQSKFFQILELSKKGSIWIPILQQAFVPLVLKQDAIDASLGLITLNTIPLTTVLSASSAAKAYAKKKE